MLGVIYSPRLMVVLPELSLMAVSRIVKAAAVVVAETPATVPLSSKTPEPMVFAPVHLGTNPFVPLPVT